MTARANSLSSRPLAIREVRRGPASLFVALVDVPARGAAAHVVARKARAIIETNHHQPLTDMIKFILSLNFIAILL